MAIPVYPVDHGSDMVSLLSRIRALETALRNQRRTPTGTTIKNYTVNHTLALVDIDALVQMERTTTPMTLTLPTNATVSIPVGQSGRIVQWGTGLLTITAAAGVAIKSVDSAHIAAARYGLIEWTKTGLNEFWLTGSITA